MSTARRQRQEEDTAGWVAPVAGHCPANATYRGTTETRSHGTRHHWTISSTSNPTATHDLWAGPGGEEPSCTCYGYRTHGHCGMTDGLPVLLGAHYRERAAKLSSLRLAMLDSEYAARHDAGTLTATDRLAWGAVGDRINERRAA